MEKRVVIIGAGISGLLACKYVVSKGFNPIVFESKDQVGGLWTQTIECTRIQTPKKFFQFSDFPWPSSVQDTFPKNTQLLEYLRSYAQHFQLLPYIKFNSEVISIDYVGQSDIEIQSWDLWGGFGNAFGSKGKWHIKVRDLKEDYTKDYEAEFVILCIGRFSGLPDIPEFDSGCGPEVFSGKVMHSMEYAAMENSQAAELIKGKRVAIIGAGKSAIDLAFECAQANGKDNPCTIIQRSLYWMLPDAKPWGVSIGFLSFTRIAELMIHKPGEGFLSGLVATLLSPVQWGASKFVESYVRWKLPIQKLGIVPEQSMVRDGATCTVFFLLEKFPEKMKDGSIIFKKSQNFSFCQDGLILEGETNPLKADIVIFATGYKGDEKLRNIFTSQIFQKYIAGSQSTTVPLYRQIIHPRIPQLAIVGYSESLANLYTFELRCMWLSFFLDRTFQLPSIKQMEDDINMWELYFKQYSVNGKFRRACIGGVQIWYNDQLCKDIGCNPRRKKGFFKDLLVPYTAADYKGLAPGF